MLKSIIGSILLFTCSSLSAQHIVVRKPDQLPAPPTVETKDTFKFAGKNTYKTLILPKKRKIDEMITECDFTSDPDKVPQLPYVTNYVDSEIVKVLKEKYKGRLYSITGLVSNVKDEQHFKLRVCKKGKLEPEYVNEKGIVIENPTLDPF
jgi:hypothetical protein